MSVHRLPRAESPAAETLAQRMERVRAEAAEIAQAHTNEFQRIITEALRYADDIASGGEAYHVGVREIARSLGMDLRDSMLALEVLRGRTQERALASTTEQAAAS